MRRRPVQVPVDTSSLYYTVREWPDSGVLFQVTQHDAITRRDLFESVAVFGAIGSGKTSGSGALLLGSMLADGWGGFIATTKPGEADEIEKLCRRHGRGGDVVRVRPDGSASFNWMRYEFKVGSGVTSNIADTLTTFTGFLRPEQQLQSSDNHRFFEENAARRLIEALDLIKLAGASPDLELIGEILTTAPKSEEDLEGKRFQQGPILSLIESARGRASGPVQLRILRRVEDFWIKDAFEGSDRTVADINITLQTAMFRLTQDPIRELIASERGCSFAPEMAEVGGIILFDAPAMLYGPAGRFLTRMHKYLFQQAMSRRQGVTSATRPAFIYCDEAQSYLAPNDGEFQAVVRDRRCATIYLSQTLDNYVTVLGSRERAEQLLAGLTLKVFHANGGTTNDYASKLIANSWQDVTNHSHQQRSQQGASTHGLTVNQQVHPQVLAGEFTRLRTGGPENGGCVDAVVFKPGRRFRLSGGPHVRTTFQQGARA